MTMETEPVFYTYLIKCIPTNEFYYGVRYCKNSNPNELWQTYFTSSKHVAERIKMFGKEQFLYEVRQTFNCSVKARKWETKVLKKINAVKRSDFLNKTHALCFNNRSFKENKKMMFFPDKNEYKWVDLKLVDYYVLNNLGIIKGQPKSESFKQHISNKLKNIPKSKSHKQKMLEFSKKRKGAKKGSLVEQFGTEKAAKIAKTISKNLKKFYNQNDHPAKGKTYEEIYGAEGASVLKQKRARQFTENNPSHLAKGKTYEERYGKEKAKQLKESRAKTSKNNDKVYNIYEKGILIFCGNRIDAVVFLAQKLNKKKSNANILYNTNLLSENNITLETQYRLH